jgi:signal transduction histidine kinase
MRTSRRRRSRPQAAAFSGALWITLIAVATTVVALTVQHIQTAALIDTELGHLIAGETDALTLRYQDGGKASLAAYIDMQVRTSSRDVVYLLADRTGRRISGNVVSWPLGLPERVVTTLTVRVEARGGVQERRIDGTMRTLGPDAQLLVGHLADGRIALGERYWISLLLSILITAALSLALGWFVSQRGLRFVKQAAETGDRFLTGRLDERLVVSKRDDEFDRLSEVVNACFDEIERMVESLRAATDGLAHDLKTPLTRIKARMELAVLRNEGGSQSEVLAETARDLDAMLELINGLLALARADATTADSFEALDLSSIVREALDLYAPLAEDRGQRLVVDLAPAITQGVPSLLLHAAANLIDNAVKYSPRGGQVVVRTFLDHGDACLSVADQGAGIAPDQRERAVRRFGRLDESRSAPGSGLGLTLVQTVARLHRGQLVLTDNHPGLRAELRLGANPR